VETSKLSKLRFHSESQFIIMFGDLKYVSGFYFIGFCSFSTSLSTTASYQSYRWTKWFATWTFVDIHFWWNIIHRRDSLP